MGLSSFFQSRWLGLCLVVFLVLGVSLLILTNERYLPAINPELINETNLVTKPLRPLDIVLAVNQVRTESGASELTTDSRLFKSAMAKANDMCDRGYFSHESPTGLNPWYWLNQSQFEFASAGENLARNVTALPELIESWKKSPTHFQNMIDARFTLTGVAIKTCTIENQETMVVVQHFASPTPAK